MAGAALSAAIVGVAAAMTAGLVGVASAASFAQRLTGVADAAALAAADAASGAATGVPCERAERIAAVTAVVVVACEVDDLIATVTVGAAFGRFRVTASSRAGPPPEGE